MSQKKCTYQGTEVKLPVQFTSKPITGWGGLRVMAKWFERLGVRESAKQIFAELLPGSNRGYHPCEYIISFMASLFMGAWRIVHIDLLRWDEPVQAMFGLRHVPSPSSLSRFFRKFSWQRNYSLWPQWNRTFMEKARSRFSIYGETIDLDSSVFERYGKQEGSEIGYNPKKRGRPSHHPLFAVAAGTKWILHLWLRGGRSGSATRAVEFIEEMLHGLPKWFRVHDLRMDSGFFSGAVFDVLEHHSLVYTVAARCRETIRRAVMEITQWTPIDVGIEIGETIYQATEWCHPRRIVAIRQELADRPTAQGKLFPLAPGYRFQVLATNSSAPPIEIWRHYNKRADVENRIQEWKDDFFMDGFALENFFATEATLWLVAITFNLTEWFKSVVIDGNHPRLMTLRIKHFLCGGWLGSKQGRLVLRLHARPTLQCWIAKALKILETVPILYCNAMAET